MSDLITMLSAASGAGGAEEADPNFNQTVLLLHGDGTNGAQNNTFLDSSTNNFTITRNGNTTQGTFSPFSVGAGEWSNYFDGSGDYLSIAYNAALTMPAGTDFCMEAWVYKTVDGAVETILASYPGATSGNWLFRINASNKLNLYAYPNNTIANAVSTTSVTANQWFHVAATREGTTYRLFVNGVLESTVTTTQNLGNANAVYVGRQQDNTAQDFSGYISNCRMVIGSAVYTASFTPSTTPLTAITNTQLLTCQSNRFVDNSTNAFAITVNGNTSVQPFSPFAPSAAYDASVNGGSGYFDGTTDHLLVAASTGSWADFGTGDFTIEAWVYVPSVSGIKGICGAHTGGQTNTWQFRLNGSTLELFGAGAQACASTTSVSANQWVFVTASRSGANAYLGVNGTVNTVAITAGAGGLFSATSGGNVSIANLYSTPSNYWLTGYISNLRIRKGTAAYTSSFTPPTAPLTAVTNTELLCNFTNAGIFDNTGKNNLETVGNAQIDTTTKKFGTGSMEFDGTGDYLLAKNFDNLAFGTGDFTIEFWLYLNTNAIEQWFIAFNGPGINTIYFNSGTIRWYANSGLRITGASLSASTWYHIALSRENGSTKLFVDGTQSGSTYADTNSYIPTSFGIGARYDGVAPMNGFIDDLRITKGVARYTTTFTPPDKAFLDQ